MQVQMGHQNGKLILQELQVKDMTRMRAALKRLEESNQAR
jgi:hypothetical protein